MARDPLVGYLALRRDFGDAVRLPFAPGRAFYLLSRPEHAEHVLVAHQDRYVKAFTYRPLKAILGDGLLTSEGDTWRRHRRLVQPVFAHRHVQSFAGDMVAAARERAGSWQPGDTLDVAAEMRALTMDVVGRTLFGRELAADAAPVGQAVSRIQRAAMTAMFLPTGGSVRANRVLATHVPGIAGAVATVEGLVEDIIAARIAAPHQHPRDLLDRLIAATEGERPFDIVEIRDEVLTLILAGHDTTANTLTWTLLLLSRFPAVRERVRAEVDEVLADRDPCAADADSLTWTRAVISEAWRLYPPAWTIEREAVTDDVVAGIEVPAGSTVAVSPYLLHRHPEFWPNPEGFDPRRFLPEHADERPKYAYLPFGGGRRICVGAAFAQLEATLVLAAVLRTHQLDLVPGTSVRPRADITLHPRDEVPMVVVPRAG